MIHSTSTASSLSNCAQNAICIIGASTGSNAASGLSSGHGPNLIYADNGGGIYLSGQGGSASTSAMSLSSTDILANSGAITLVAFGASGTNAVQLNAASSGNYLASNSGCHAIYSVCSNTTSGSSTAAVYIYADSLSFSGSNTTTLNTTGALTIAPYGTDTFASAFTWSGGSGANFVGASSTTLYGLTISNQANLTGLTLGSSTNTANVTIGSNTSIAGPINVTGGQVNINANLLDTQNTANAGIQILAASNITFPASAITLSTASASPVLLNANSLGTGGTIYGLSGSVLTITTQGGNITLGGGVGLNGSGFATSPDVPVTFNGDAHEDGIALPGIVFSSGAGNVLMKGMSYGGATVSAKYASGIWINSSTSSITTTTGSITIDGEVQSGASGYTGGYYGVYFGSTTSLVSGSGNITVTGINAATTTSHNGLNALYTGNITTASGLITLNANSAASTSTAFASPASTYLGTASGGVSDTNNIVINASSLSLGSSTNIKTSGTLTIAPYGSSFTSAFTWPSDVTLANNVTGLTLGSSTNTADITLGSSFSVAGPIAVTGGNLTVNAGLTSSGTTTLTSTATVSEGGSGIVTASSLLLRGGAVNLSNNSNSVGILAASGVSSLIYINSGALSIGTVASTSGLAATGTVLVATQSGNLTLAGNVSTSNATSTAVVLDAGKATAAGTSTGGDLIVTGSPTVTAGTGGTVQLMAGSVSGSTGLTNLVGSGSGHFRYNSSYGTSNYTTALAANVINAIYRQQVTATVTTSTQNIIYGDSISIAETVSGTQGGDTGVLSVVSGQYSSSGLLAYSATSYTLASSLSNLGYTISGSVGTVSVAQKALTTSNLSSANKVYDGTRTATVSGTAALQVSTSIANGNSSDGKPITGDTVNLSGTAVGNFNTADVLTANTVNFSGLSLTGTDAGNYTLTSSVAASITPKTVGLSVTKTYDGTTSLSGGQLAISTGMGPQTLTYSGATLSSAHVATVNNYVNAVTLADGSNGGLASNYQLPSLTASSANNAVIMSAASLTPTTLTNTGVSKAYDGTTNAPAGFTPSWSWSGLVSGDTAASASYTSANYNNANVINATSITVGGLSLTGVTGSRGSQASDYTLSSNSASVSAHITSAPLTVTANNAAKFVTQTDTAGFNGVSYAGFVNGQTSAVLGGSASVTRSNATNNVAGVYSGVLQASGLTSSNYTISYVSGNYTIVPSNQLLVQVANSSNTYGTANPYTITSVSYYNPLTSSVVVLSNGSVSGSSVSINSHNLVSVNDGASGTANFTLVPQSAVYSTGGLLAVGSYQLGISGAVTVNSANFSNTITVVGAQQVNPQALTVSVGGGVNKVYDGTTAMTGVSLGLSGLQTNDVVTVSGASAFSTRNAGSNLSYTINNVALSGSDAGDYYLTGLTGLTGSSSFSGNNGTITPKPVTLSPQAASKVYDGSTAYTSTTSDLSYLTGLLGVNGDTVTAATLSFADKNVGTGKTLTASAVTINDGNNGSNYAVTMGSNTSSAITRLSSVTWVGGSSGNWFDPANWAGEAVPDLANVANVVIPTGVVVSFNTAGAVVPANASSPVQIDGLGSSGGSLSNAGATNVGGFTQSGGSFIGTGTLTAGQFSQTGGSTNLSGNLVVTQGYSQGSNGTVTVGGNAQITSTAGGVQLGNLSTVGTLTVDSTGGAISQASGTSLSAGGNSSFTATQGGNSANITLGNSGNTLTGTVTAAGNNVIINDSVPLTAVLNATGTGTLTTTGTPGTLNVSGTSGNLTTTSSGNTTLDTTTVTGNLSTTSGGTTSLDTVTVGGNLSATSVGNISQPGPLIVIGTSTLDSTNGNVTLSNANNSLGGTVNATGNDVTINDSVPLTVVLNATGTSTLTTTGTPGTLNVSGTSGNLTTTSSGNTTLDTTTVTGNLSTTSGGTTSLDTVTVGGNLSTTSGGATSLGAVTVGGNLSTSSVGDVTQTGVLHVTGSLQVNSSSGQVNLRNPDNTLVGGTNIDNGFSKPVVLVPATATNAVPQSTSTCSTVVATCNSVPVQGSSANMATTLEVASPTSSASTGAISITDVATVSTPSATVSDESPATASGNPVVVTNVRTASTTQIGVVTVRLPIGTTANATETVIELPEEVSPLVANPNWKLTTAGNAPLPSWLKFDPSSRSLIVGSAMPKNAFPLQLLGSAGGMKVIIQIDEVKPKN